MVYCTTLAFWRQLGLQCMDNTIEIYPGDNGRPMRAFGRHQIVEFNLEKAPNYHGKWIGSENKIKHKYQNQRCKKHPECSNLTKAYCLCNREMSL